MAGNSQNSNNVHPAFTGTQRVVTLTYLYSGNGERHFPLIIAGKAFMVTFGSMDGGDFCQILSHQTIKDSRAQP